MYRIAATSWRSTPSLRSVTSRTARRLASTASPASRPRSWKSSAVRWGLAGGAIYYYNTSPAFADTDELSPRRSAPAAFDDDDDLPTVDSILEEKRKQIQSKLESNKEKPAPTKPETTPSSSQDQSAAAAVTEGSPEALEEEAGQQGAFNPETGEINWDCPCLGGMAHGPCGEEFKTAFSCFVYSDAEPKGMDCIEKFQGMQECFRQYPEIYGAELTDDDEAEVGDAQNASESSAAAIPSGDEAQAQPQARDAPATSGSDDHSPEATHQKMTDGASSGPSIQEAPQSKSPAAKPEAHKLPEAQTIRPEGAGDDAIPAAWEDARGANAEVQKANAESAKSQSSDNK